MHFNQHSYLAGQHARLSASKYQWINYDEDKLSRVFFAQEAARRGTELHELAHRMIQMKVKAATRPRNTFNLYVNDCIGFKMQTEVVLFYSINCFSTADAISFRRNTLRISDLKTGTTPASMKQLEVYAAIFCLEYRMKPMDIDIELRIYQNDEVLMTKGDPIEITRIMDRIIMFDKYIEKLKEEVEP